MSNKRLALPALLNGSSTQPAALRQPNQVELAENVYFSVRDAASKRPGAQHLFDIADLPVATLLRLHPIDRDANEKYLIVYGDSTLRIFDTAGTEATVTISATAQAYLDAGSATADDLRLTTIADYTLLTNTKVEVGVLTAPTYSIAGTLGNYDQVIAQLPTYDSYYFASGDTPVHPAGYWHYIVPTADNGFAYWTGATLAGDWDNVSKYWNDDNKNPVGFTISFMTQTLSLTDLVWSPDGKTVYGDGAFTSYTWQSGDRLLIHAGTGVTLGWFIIANKATADVLRLTGGPGTARSVDMRATLAGLPLTLTASYNTTTGYVTAASGTPFASYTKQAGDVLNVQHGLTVLGHHAVLNKISSSVVEITHGLTLDTPGYLVCDGIGTPIDGDVDLVWTPDLKSVIQTDAFATYVWHNHDKVNVTGGTGSTTGLYGVAERLSDHIILLTGSPGVANIDLATTGVGDSYDVTEDFYAKAADDLFDVAQRLQDRLQSLGASNALVQYVDTGTPSDNYFRIISPYRGTDAGSIVLSTLAGVTTDLTDTGKPFAGGSVTAGSGTPATVTLPVADRWEQVPAPGGVQAAFDPATMPMKITRDTTGPPATFTVAVVDWKGRLSGNEDTNPTPSLWKKAGTTIADIGFHRNRLVLAGMENLVFSQAGDFFNFWIEDADNISDADPIDAALSSNRVTVVEYVCPFRKTLVVFTKAGQQFELNAPEMLTPTTASITPSTTYNSVATVRPAMMGTQLYFPATAGTGCQLREYAYNDSYAADIAADVSSHVEGMLPAVLNTVVACPNLNVVVGVARGTPTLYRYQAYWNGAEKRMSAWGSLVLADRYSILDAAAIGNDVYLLVQTGNCNSHVVLKLPADQQTAPAGLDYLPHLDNWKLVAGTYDSQTDTTEFDYEFCDRAIDRVVLGPAWFNPDGTPIGGTDVDQPTVIPAPAGSDPNPDIYPVDPDLPAEPEIVPCTDFAETQAALTVVSSGSNCSGLTHPPDGEFAFAKYLETDNYCVWRWTKGSGSAGWTYQRAYCKTAERWFARLWAYSDLAGWGDTALPCPLAEGETLRTTGWTEVGAAAIAVDVMSFADVLDSSSGAVYGVACTGLATVTL